MVRKKKRKRGGGWESVLALSLSEGVRQWTANRPTSSTRSQSWWPS